MLELTNELLLQNFIEFLLANPRSTHPSMNRGENARNVTLSNVFSPNKFINLDGRFNLAVLI